MIIQCFINNKKISNTFKRLILFVARKLTHVAFAVVVSNFNINFPNFTFSNVNLVEVE